MRIAFMGVLHDFACKHALSNDEYIGHQQLKGKYEQVMMELIKSD